MTSVSGRVTVHGDKAAVTATVELHNSAGDVVDQVQVDDNGSYRYHLAAGHWTLKVWDAHGHRGNQELDIADGEDKTLNIDLEEPAGGH